MKNLKRMISLFACITLLLSGFTYSGGLQQVFADETAETNGTEETDETEETEVLTYEYEGHTFSYELDDGEAAITGCTDTDADTTVTELTLPSEIDGASVTSIGSSAFYGYTALTQVALPDTLTEIGSSAFYDCSALLSVDLPDGVTEIGRSAFRNCTSLETIDFSDALSEIGYYAFYNCQSLTEVLFPAELDVVYPYAFYNCTEVTYVLMPAVEASIMEDNFDQSTKITTVEYAEGATRPYTLESWTNGSSFMGYATTIILPSTMDDLTTGSWTFGGAVNTDFFSAFSNAEEFIISEDNPYYTTYDNCIYDIDLETLYVVPRAAEDIEFPDTVTKIEAGAFAGCKNITEVIVPDTVTRICGIEDYSGQHYQYGAFLSCDSLETLVIPSSVTQIGTEAISGCASLAYVSLYYEGVSYVFSGENSDYVKELTDMTIADGTSDASEITSDVFDVFSTEQLSSSTVEATDLRAGLETVHLPASTESIPTDYFDAMISLVSISVDAENETYYSENGILYSSADGGLTLVRYPVALGNADFADGLTVLGERCFYLCSSRKSFEFPETLTEVGAQAFYKLLNIDVTFAEGLTTIGDEAFSGCLNSTVYVPASVTSIGTDAFDTLDGSCVVICEAGSYAETYAKENGLTYSNGSEAESDSSSENTGSVSKTKGAAVGTKATVSGLTYKVTSSSAVTVTGTTKKNASKVTIPATVKINGKSYKVTQIAASAFAKNKKLKTVVIGKNVKKIGKKAFYNCTKLKNMTFKGKNVTTIGAKAFKGTVKKATVKVPKAKKAAYKKLLKKAGLSAKAKIK